MKRNLPFWIHISNRICLLETETELKQYLPFFLWNLPFIEMENRCPYVSVNRLIHEYVNLNDSKLTTVLNHYEY